MQTDWRLSKQAWKANRKQFSKTLRELKRKKPSLIEAEMQAHMNEPAVLIKAKRNVTPE